MEHVNFVWIPLLCDKEGFAVMLGVVPTRVGSNGVVLGI